MKTVAIIGGGFSGTSLAATLLTMSDDPVEVLLFDRSGSFGAGAAYTSQDPHHWLNVPSTAMSAFEDQPDHFSSWLSRHHEGEQVDFAKRSTYRRYLTSLLAMPPRNPMSILRTLGEEVVRIDDGFCLQTSSGRHGADAVVLATGYLPESKFASAIEWPQKEVRDAVIIGSGLSALDAAASIFGRSPDARVVCFSRHGLVPQPFEGLPRTWTLSSSFPTSSLRAFVRWIRREISLAEAKGAGWSAVFDAMRPHWESVWKILHPRDRVRFRTHLARYFECFRHRIPPPLHQHLAPYFASGALVVRKGVVERYGEGDVNLRDGRRMTADLIVNATGPSWRWDRSSDPLYRALFGSGQIFPGPMGTGLKADDRGCLGGNLFVVGPPLRGGRWETTAVREIRRQVRDLADMLLASSLGWCMETGSKD